MSRSLRNRQARRPPARFDDGERGTGVQAGGQQQGGAETAVAVYVSDAHKSVIGDQWLVASEA